MAQKTDLSADRNLLRNTVRKEIILIPSFHPDHRLGELIIGLRREGFHAIIVIDDGSGPDDRAMFKEAESFGCVVAAHKRNLGKGAALKTGIRTAVERFGAGNTYLTVDGDGQHHPSDVRRVADALEQEPGRLVLGIRDFYAEGVPWKSRLGNRVTSALFRLTSGVSCPDTQTGLRGIPACLEELALQEEGERYEYELNFLTDAVKLVPFRFVPIQTLYQDQNRGSHFRPVADSIRVYGKFLRFLTASVLGAAADYLFFYLFSIMLTLPQTQTIFLATALARVGSCALNFILNRYWSFRSRMQAAGQSVRYAVLAVCQMTVSGGSVSLLARLGLPAMLSKVIADTCLFFVSYNIQKKWVFRKELVK